MTDATATFGTFLLKKEGTDTPHSPSPDDHADLTKWLGGRSFAELKAEYDTRGYLVFKNVMSPDEVERVRTALAPYLTRKGRNDFEGFNSNRVYSLLAKAPDVFSDMITHPLALGFVEAELGSSALLSALLAINLHPGETVQDWHQDDGHIEIPLPRPAYGVSTFWTIDDTTEDNGATEIIPGSHLWGDDQRMPGSTHDVLFTPGGKSVDTDPFPHEDTVKVTMPAGSLMIAKGTLWHRGGANRSNAPRLIVTPQYCPGWARPLENTMLSTPQDITVKLPRRVRELIGYSIHGAFMGYTDGKHPDKFLDGVR